MERTEAEDLVAQLEQGARVTVRGEELAERLASGTETEDRPEELSEDERLCFFQALARLPEDQIEQVIDGLGGIVRFLSFLCKEAEDRRHRDQDRFCWETRVQIDPRKAFKGNFPAVCPAVLRCRSFLTFHNVLKEESKIATQRLPDWREFLEASNKFYSKESDRCDAVFPFFTKWMEDIPGVAAWNAQSKRFSDTDSRIDIAFFVPALKDWPLVIIEDKNEAHSSTKADPIAQSTHYYLQQLDNCPIRAAFNAPTLILQIVGTHVAAHAAILSGHDSNGPAFVGTHLLAEIDMGVNPDMDDLHQRRVNAFWLAIKACVRELVHEIALQLVIDLARTPWRTRPKNWCALLDWHPAHAFPWITRAGDYRFRYECGFGEDKLVFKARLEGEGEGEYIVVKFVNHTHYAAEAHNLLAREGFAPQLLHVDVIHEDWTMLLIEWKGDMKNVAEFKQENLTEAHRQREAHALRLLHEAGFVHGDLRNDNVLADESGRVCIIDFDWCGERGSALYPVLMNRAIDWPSGATSTAPIEQDHDRWWHNKRYSHLATQQQEQAQQQQHQQPEQQQDDDTESVGVDPNM